MDRQLMQTLVSLLKAGHLLDKHSAAVALKCDLRTAQRHLTHLHAENHVFVMSWSRQKGGMLPLYAWGFDQKDAPRPKSISSVDRSRAYRQKQLIKLGAFGI